MAKGKKTFFFGFLLLLGFMAIVYIAFVTYGELNKKKQVQVEIEKLQAEAERVDSENNLIQEKIAYLQSSDYKGLEAKSSLNLQNPGENVVVIKPSIVKVNNVEVEKPEEKFVAAAPVNSSPNSNFIKWYAYFFN